MLFKTFQAVVILGSIGIASADAFADFLGFHVGVPAMNSASFPKASGYAPAASGYALAAKGNAPASGYAVASGFAAAPTANLVRKLKVKYDLAPTSAAFAVPEPTPVRARRERRGAFGTTGTGTGCGPTGTGSAGFPFPTTFATALKPLPVPTALPEKRDDAPEEWWMDTLKRWIQGEQAGPENVRR